MRFDKLRFTLEELKFVRSRNDVGILCQKLPFLLPRLTGNYIRDTIVPPSLQLEPTNHCNLKCISCPRDTMARAKGYMDFGLFQKIIDNAASVGVRRVHLYLHGEPLLHPEITRMIAYMKSKDVGMSLTTNGMLLDRKTIDALLESGVNSADYVTFSILGYSKEVHEKIMRGVDHDKVSQNVTDLLELRKKRKINGPIVQTIFYQMPENTHEARQYSEKWKDIVDHALSGPTISQSFAMYDSEGNSRVPFRTRTCTQIWERMTIFWNGDVTVCCEDVNGDYVLGNLKEESIKEIWKCSKLESIKRLHKEKRFHKITLCCRCDL